MALIPFEMAIVIAFAVFFSSFSTPILSAVLTFMLWVIGMFTVSLQIFINMLEEHSTKGEWAPLIKVIYWPLPHLGVFNVSNRVLHAAQGPDLSAFPFIYGILYSGTILFFAILVFRRKDIK
jgi:Cu-processing system permease protein